jgi:hypothetical protein
LGYSNPILWQPGNLDERNAVEISKSNLSFFFLVALFLFHTGRQAEAFHPFSSLQLFLFSFLSAALPLSHKDPHYDFLSINNIQYTS